MPCVGPMCDPLPGHALTLSKILDLYVESPAASQPWPRMWQTWPNLGSPCTYVLNKPKQVERSTGLPSYRESYRGTRSRAPVYGFAGGRPPERWNHMKTCMCP